jgi:hypothetical protein
MKTPEDEAFDDLARRQGMWGGGYRAKRAAAADKLQEPIYKITVIDNAHPKGIPFEDWVQPAQEPVACARCKQLEEQAYDLLGKLKVANLKWSVAHPWIGLTDEEIRDCLGPEAVCIPPGWSRLTRAIEAKLKEKNS